MSPNGPRCVRLNQCLFLEIVRDLFAFFFLFEGNCFIFTFSGPVLYSFIVSQYYYEHPTVKTICDDLQLSDLWIV